MELTRRAFLKTAAAGAALMGLGASGLSFASEEAARDFSIAPVQRKDAGEAKYSCEYLVIGGGNCGMMSAAHAAKLGLDVLVLEKAAKTGGSSIGTEVTMAFYDCKIMQECQEDPEVINVTRPSGSYKDIYTYFMMHNSWESNAKLVMNYVHNNHRVHDFLYEEGGYPFMLLPALDSPTCGIMYKGEGPGAFAVMEAAAVKYGARILTETPATALVMEEGKVVGVMATEAGNPIFVSAKAVFIGTGGFSSNKEMVAHYIPGHGPIAYKVDESFCHDGDGIRMMLGAGAVESDMGFAQPAASSVPGALWESGVDKAGREPYLWVNHLGERLGNEKWTVMDNTFKVGLKENEHYYFNIVDTAALERMQTQDLFTGARTVLGSMAPVEDMIEQVEAGVAEGIVFKGESIEELSAAAGIDAEGLKATVARYNELCAAGEDSDFYKEAAYLFSLEKGPFYAFPQVPSWYSTLCGVKINGQTQVVDAEGRAIPGLYAGGLDSGEFFKDNYNHGFSGSCSGYSYFSGFFAAEQAAAYMGK